MLIVLFLGGLARPGTGQERDFFKYNRYPGPGTRPGVELYEVKQSRSGDATDYQRRVVDWWPREGVDTIPVEENMPLRTWTLRNPGNYYLPEQFEAHLIGFRGIGNPIGNPYDDNPTPVYPAVVLRMSDGSKRCFTDGTFVKEDNQYIMDLYMKEMERLREQVKDVKYRTKSGTRKKYLKDTKPGEKRRQRWETDHVVIKTDTRNKDYNHWINSEHPEKAKKWRRSSMTFLEHWWAFLEYSGRLMRYWDRQEKYRYEANLTGKAGGGYASSSVGELGPRPGTLIHEWGHGSATYNTEAFADWLKQLVNPRGTGNGPDDWRSIQMSGYGNYVVESMIGNDPNWGYAWWTAVPNAAGDEPWGWFGRLARIGQQRGLYENGIRGFGDLIGAITARMAEFDTEKQSILRRDHFAPRLSWLKPIDREEGLYRVPREQTPEPYGHNIYRLTPEEGAEKIVIDFQGLHNPDHYSDWRACIVAVGKDGEPRYSPLWNKGRMTMKRQEGDRRYWLTVAATPTAMNTSGSLRKGPHAARYPYRVGLEGARPGTPFHMRIDADDYEQIYNKPGEIGNGVPANWDRPHADRYKQIEGAPHPNGGGWVAEGAEVADSAYVGPEAMVLGKAKVKDQAVIEDYAIVKEKAVVEDHARISGMAVVEDKARVHGRAQYWHKIQDENTTEGLPGTVPKSGLWANYALDQDEQLRLENFYRRLGPAEDRGGFYRLNLDGYQIGDPEFVAEGDRRGFRFDGKKDAGELSTHAAQLPEMTVVMNVKWQGEGRQTLFDFGSGANNRFRLVTEGTEGGPALRATVEGERVLELAGSEPLPTGKWVQLRVMLDGETASLWVDGKQVEQKESGFRPAHAFKPGAEKRNFIAAGRRGRGHFKGVFDSILIYNRVHSRGFSDVPDPRMDTPRHPTKEFVRWVRTQREVSPYEVEKRASEAAAETNKYYKHLGVKASVRLWEIRNRSEVWKKTVRAVRRWERRSEEEREMEKKDVIKRVSKARDKAKQPYRPEWETLVSFSRQRVDKFYNRPYQKYIDNYYRSKFGEPRLNVDLSKSWSLARKNEENWKTGVHQWDWRTPWEANGSVKNLPLVEEWIKRVRGEVVLESPVQNRQKQTMDESAVKARIQEIERRLEEIEKEAKAAVKKMPQTKKEKKEIARLEKKLKRVEERVNPGEILKKARKQDERFYRKIEKAKNEEKFLKRYTDRGGFRRRRSRRKALDGGKKVHTWALRQELKQNNPEYRKWANLKERLKKLRRQERYRLELYYLRRTNRSYLEDRLEQLKNKLKSD